MSFDYIKDIFSFLDVNQIGQISYKEFCMLSEDNLHKMNFLDAFLSNLVEKKKHLGTSERANP